MTLQCKKIDHTKNAAITLRFIIIFLKLDMQVLFYLILYFLTEKTDYHLQLVSTCKQMRIITIFGKQSDGQLPGGL